MDKVIKATAVLMMTTTLAHAGGLDRSGQGVGIIFEDGNTFQLSLGSINPTVSGVATGPGLTGASGDMADSYTQLSLAYKHELNDNLSLAIIMDQPFGANVDYADASGGYYATGGAAEVNSTAFTAVARYEMGNGFSVHGGLRYQTVDANVTLPSSATTLYNVDGDGSSGTGYLIGAAYEKPDIALRVALTYNSKVGHEMDVRESTLLAATGASLGFADSTTEFDTPESINLDFQTGIAADTLLFGSIRYAKWTQFSFEPIGYVTANGEALQDYDNDVVSYNVGIGRRFNDTWSGAITYAYEAGDGEFVGNLGPTDGSKAIGIGATYTGDGYKVTAGMRHIWLGDGDTEHPVVDGITGAEFRDNTARAFGVQFTTSF
ncbi:OmpP1/FadL family transporter [Aestuariibius sp. HNIBRBA575]|uniref:OmpP1/FadL family transporter n=1 Tax=Aestuariibius sp. HNIBRBA575 TaxID=3233343 RepID=UPI0034A2D6E9